MGSAGLPRTRLLGHGPVAPAVSSYLGTALNATIASEVAAPIAAAVAPKLDATTAATTYAPKSTAIAKWVTPAGQQVISPNGDIVSAKASDPSGASFNPANWDYLQFTDFFVSVKKFGAKGDGVTNDTAAIQAALDAAAGKIVSVPVGVYPITAGLVQGRTTSMVLAPSATIKATATTAGAMLTISDLSD